LLQLGFGVRKAGSLRPAVNNVNASAASRPILILCCNKARVHRPNIAATRQIWKLSSAPNTSASLLALRTRSCGFSKVTVVSGETLRVTQTLEPITLS
jgi:hypothetical protein